MTTSAPVTTRIEFLDSLRGVAILAVMALHFGVVVEVTPETFRNVLFLPIVWPLVRHGYLGVELFFVISGYCISAAIYSSVTKPSPFKHFTWRRIRRIYPPYWASIVLTVLLAVGTMLFTGHTWASIFPLSPYG